MKEEKHVQVGSKERIGDVWYFSANTYSNGGGYGLIYKNGEAYYEPQKYPKDEIVYIPESTIGRIRQTFWSRIANDITKTPMLREGQNLNKTIYSTDADALEKLEARLEEQEKKYAEMKKLNKYFRENCTVKGYPGIDDEKAAKIDERISNAYSWCKAPYPQYEMQSMSQKIRATKERIKSLETEQTREETEYDTDGLGFDVVENKEIARLQIIYPGGGRVDNETYKRLRENGFVFSRTNGAFQRQLNENSRYAVRRFIQSQRNIVEQMSTKKETEAEM